MLGLLVLASAAAPPAALAGSVRVAGTPAQGTRVAFVLPQLAPARVTKAVLHAAGRTRPVALVAVRRALAAHPRRLILALGRPRVRRAFLEIFLTTPSASAPAVPSATPTSSPQAPPATTTTTTPLPAPVLTAPAVSWWKPPAHLAWQIQYSGPVDPSATPADAYDIDGFDATAATVAAIHARGMKAICYFSAGSVEDWRPDSAQFPAQAVGNPLDGWPGERWLDVRQIAALEPIMDARLDMCAQKGFDAADPDNVDGYANDTGFPLTAADQLAYDRMLAADAHARGLAVALKNDLDQIPDLVGSFDLAVDEQCHEYAECDALAPFTAAGKPVIDVEYAISHDAACSDAAARGFMTARKHLALDAWIDPCW